MSIKKDYSFNRGEARRLFVEAMMSDIDRNIRAMEDIWDIDDESESRNIYDLYLDKEGIKESIEKIANTVVDSMEDEWYRRTRCAYCNSVINTKKSHCYFTITKEYFCDKDCWINGIENHLDVMEEE